MKRLCSIMSLISLLLVLLVLPVHGQERNYVTDEALLLTDSQWETLEIMCAEISKEYDCGVYIITLEEHVGDAYDMAQNIYHDHSLGEGDEKNGILLLLSMENKDYALFVCGEDAEYAIDEYGAQQLEEEFLPYLQEDDWYGAFEAYVRTCWEYLELEEGGEPVRASNAGAYLIAIAVSFVVALIVCLILKSGMKNVRIKTEAAAYTAGALHLIGQTDRFTHKTQTRVKINSDSGKSTARAGGGGHGRSGKF